MHFRPGLAVRNPLGQEPWVLDLVTVDHLDQELMVRVHAVQGIVRVSLDWSVELCTAATADAETALVIEEQQRRAHR
jgi:hypothetical protein